MNKDKLASVLGFSIALIVCSIVAWLALSAMVSFVRLEWATATETSLGRIAFVVVVAWIARVMLREDKA